MFDTAYEPTAGASGVPLVSPGQDDGPAERKKRRVFRIMPPSYHDAKECILNRCLEVICRKGLEVVDVQRGGYASWRSKTHQYLLNQDYHYFGLDSALILAAAVGVKVDIKAL